MEGTDFDAYLAAAEEAFRRDGSDESLTRTGFAELMSEPLGAPGVCDPVFATFVAHGRCLARSSALFRLLAAPYLRAAGQPSGDVVACPVVRRDGDRVLVAAPAWVPGDHIVVDLVDDGVLLVETRHAVLADATPFDPTLVAVRSIGLDDLVASRRLDLDAPAARTAALAAARLAAAHEILGAAESLLDIGRVYAGDRTQFGQRIAHFQAVQHMLASSSLDIQSTAHVCRAARRGRLTDPVTATVAKAVAGRNGRRLADRTGQVLGGISFTWEHPFHTFHRRIVVLDGMLGSSAELFAELGAAVAAGLAPADVLPLSAQTADLALERESLA